MAIFFVHIKTGQIKFIDKYTNFQFGVLIKICLFSVIVNALQAINFG